MNWDKNYDWRKTMYKIKLHNPKTIAKRFLALSGSSDWKRGELSVQQNETYLLVVGEKPLKMSEEKDEKRRVSVYLSDDLVKIFEGRLISYHFPVSYELHGRGDQYILNFSCSTLFDIHSESKTRLNQEPERTIEAWEGQHLQASLGIKKPTPMETNRSPIVPLTKVKKKDDRSFRQKIERFIFGE